MNHKSLSVMMLFTMSTLSIGFGNFSSSQKSASKYDNPYDVTLKRPSDYKGDWWVTEHVPSAKYFQYSEMSFNKKYPNGFFVEDDHRRSNKNYYIRYIFMDYQESFLVHSMRITNPDIYFYGLNIYSSKEEIKMTLDELSGFKTYPLEFSPSLKLIATYKDKIDFLFFEDAICIQMQLPKEN